ncbi:MarR family transcriptional regulator [Lentzea sp. BCCO 10_0061]|uniref:MarR family transcriptional regulator n=1 Tax=Lentzea sokolovensis TaxID=3095429 RepID=A0ABU4V2N1_9PSEU|nr:MarR family transcriptional regulator [Lentzea sp. BCCO 10_0061]MDX8146062.1 MarR family transcriptional regulator [Lentzea sp. BCCO 10_0061]
MPGVDLMDIDLATLAYLAGSSANDAILKRLHEIGHEGVRVSHGYVIQHLIEGAPTVSELGELLGVTQQAASKQLLELERLGYVTREPDRTDSRIKRAGLTDRGRRLVEDSRRLRGELDVHGDDAVKRALIRLLDATGGTETVLKRRVVTA